MNAVLLLGIPLGLLLASVMPYMAAGKFGPVQLAAYVQAYVLVLLPNLVLIGACMFAAAALTRQALATYVGGVALFVLGTLAGDLTDGLANRTLSALARPVRRRARSREATRFWTPAERNARLIGWPELMLVEPRALARRRARRARAARRALPLRAPGERRAAPLVAPRRWSTRRQSASAPIAAPRVARRASARSRSARVRGRRSPSRRARGARSRRRAPSS